MRLWILSDLHLDHAAMPRLRVPDADADVAVVAGDVREGITEAVAWLADVVRPRMDVVCVAGNHEFHGGALDEDIVTGRRVARARGIHFLEDDLVRIGGVAFAGATLWTDYALRGVPRRPAAMVAAAAGMSDHRLIAATRRPAWRPFLPADALQRHAASVAFLETLAAGRPDGPLVVVTHHAPSAACLDARFAGSALNPAFASALDPLVGRLGADLWVHGHTHAPGDRMLGRTRAVCNPRGYGRENPAFDPALVIDL